jgi:membrane protein DedA with SNARE-associated domain
MAGRKDQHRAESRPQVRPGSSEDRGYATIDPDETGLTEPNGRPPVSLTIAALHILRHVPTASIDYAALAVGAFLSWVGVPGPGEPLLIAAGIVAAKSKLDIEPVLVWAWVGAVSGGIVGWVVGIVAGRRVMTAPGPLRGLRLKAVERGEEVFERLTVIAILLAPSWVAGIHRVNTGIYVITTVLSAAAWSVGIGLGAYYVGPAVLDVLVDIGWVSAIGVTLLVVVGIGLEVTRRRRRGPEAS